MVPYTVYMDESFYEFWGLQNPEGNFCYAVFGLPDLHLRTLDQFHAEFPWDFQTVGCVNLTVAQPNGDCFERPALASRIQRHRHRSSSAQGSK